MKGHTTSTAIPSHALKIEALASISASFEAFCLASGIGALSEMMADDAQTACGRRTCADQIVRRTAGVRRKGRSASTAA